MRTSDIGPRFSGFAHLFYFVKSVEAVGMEVIWRRDGREVSPIDQLSGKFSTGSIGLLLARSMTAASATGVQHVYLIKLCSTRRLRLSRSICTRR